MKKFLALSLAAIALAGCKSTNTSFVPVAGNLEMVVATAGGRGTYMTPGSAPVAIPDGLVFITSSGGKLTLSGRKSVASKILNMKKELENNQPYLINSPANSPSSVGPLNGPATYRLRGLYSSGALRRGGTTWRANIVSRQFEIPNAVYVRVYDPPANSGLPQIYVVNTHGGGALPVTHTLIAPASAEQAFTDWQFRPWTASVTINDWMNSIIREDLAR